MEADRKPEPEPEPVKPVIKQSRGISAAQQAPLQPAPMNIMVQEDHFDKRRQAHEHLLQHRAGAPMPGVDMKVDDQAVSELGSEMTLMEMAREYAEQRLGRTVRGREEIFRHSFLSTGDFPLLLENVQNKRLLGIYQQIPATWRTIARVTTAPDFKNISVYAYDGTPKMEEILEHGEVTYEGATEAKDSYRVKTYAKGFRVTRQAIINDDLNFLSRKPMEFARAAISLENELVWNLIRTNANVFGTQLFDTSHKNVGTDALSEAALTSAFNAIATQTDRNGNTILDMSYNRLVVPVKLRVTASKLLNSIFYPTTHTATLDPMVRSIDLTVEPLLDKDTATSYFYLFSSPSAVDIVEAAYLGGRQAPTIMQESSHSIMGLDYMAVHDFGAKVVDYFGAYRGGA